MFKVKHGNRHLTALITFDHGHFNMIGRYRQNKHTLVTLRSQGQSQGHQGQSHMPNKKPIYMKQLLYAEFKFVVIYYG